MEMYVCSEPCGFREVFRANFCLFLLGICSPRPLDQGHPVSETDKMRGRGKRGEVRGEREVRGKRGERERGRGKRGERERKGKKDG